MTIVLVALTMIAIMAMAALSIDVVTLYLANAEAQRAADAAALAGARILSITGMTGDPNNTGGHWQQACDFASKVAVAVAEQNIVGGTAPTGVGQVTVTFPNNSDAAACTGDSPAFGVNPLVTVKVQSASLPTFFARIWGQTGASVSATATAEAFNSSNSDTVGNGGPSTLTPVQPRCVKPWIVPNRDPENGTISCTGNTCPHFVSNTDGSIQSKGIGGAGIIGRTFNLFANCDGTTCGPLAPMTNVVTSPLGFPPPPPTPNLEYLPGEIAPSFSASAVPSCAADLYQDAVAGCDETTVYQCGVKSVSASPPNRVDLSENPSGTSGDTVVAAQCLIDPKGKGSDTLDTSTYPYHFKAGDGNPLVLAGALSGDNTITNSNSVVTLPIYNGGFINPNGKTDVTIVGFLQVFINRINNVDAPGYLNVTVLNVTGCGDGDNAVGTAVSGTSPVPVRLITYP